jgi:NADPH:quinone reductase-like Zn-dependent oxidoreductase
MKAIILTGTGDSSVLQISELPIPPIGNEEVLVQVKAISINPVDVKTRAGSGAYASLKNEHPIILGWDLAGIIVKKGKAVSGFSVGDEVFGMVNFPGHGKAYAEYVSVPASQLAKKPWNVTFEEAAATTLAALTAYQALFIKGNIQKEDKVLIHAAAGGVGHFAVQLAKYAEAFVVGTSSAVNRDFVLSLGADEQVDYKGTALEENVKGITLCLDTIGGENIRRSLKLMSPGGTLISIPSGKNESVEAEAKEYGVHGTVFKVVSNGLDMKLLAQLLEQRIIRPYIAAIYPFEQIREAHEKLETGRTTGKIVVVI